MIVVVTGATGFLGQSLVRRLLAEGHHVRCLVRPGSGRTPVGAMRAVVRYDDEQTLLDTEALDDADVVIHAAGVTKAASARAFDAGNVTPTRNLVGAITARRLTPRFLLISSQAAAGPARTLDRPVTEHDAPIPVDAYGRSKLEAERVVEREADRLPITTLRPCSFYGPGDRDFLLLFRWARAGLLVYPGTVQHWLSLLHVDDVVDGILAAARSPGAIGRTYFLSSEQPVQWRALGAAIATVEQRSVRHLNLPLALVSGVSALADVLANVAGRAWLANRSKATLATHQFWVCSASRARLELGVQPHRSLPDGLRETYYWYLQEGWIAAASARNVIA